MINKRVFGDTINELESNLLATLYFATVNNNPNLVYYSTKTFDELCSLFNKDESGKYFVDVDFVVSQRINYSR